MYYTGFADEAGIGLDAQIRATKELGWTRIESRNIDGMNIHDLPDNQFDLVAGKLEDQGISINCFGSTVANWSRDPRSEEDYQKSLNELKRAFPRMERLGCTMIRGMSFTRFRDASLYTPELEQRIFEKLRGLVRLCEEAGVYYMHENCANYGGMSSEHALRLVEEIDSPHFKLLFDTGNPLNSVDYREGHSDHMQDALQFYTAIKEHVAYVHIKDGVFRKMQHEELFNSSDWCFPGDGEGKVREIVADLIQRGYDGGFSIEPHMASVYHDSDVSSEEELKYANYVEYGRRFMKIVETFKQSPPPEAPL
ncbi:sugar phosphate isomerase/epimerase [Oceanispirochaeta sp.]|jgi:sugar phosphate isomerase/epimerase|uniref:sugar phosphate isomerase/epimerase family protein n=1 Tax=Oceanispirochaeta sp. TaxID=2035350 RepID=UPI00260A451C|nr:sugar phosphate isomerase/epimerase family protein [Oceanispirochaeta sp.]MDA3956778.1 sugar phosphate isomerase/epimerase [Oceanispirochaeta sp.]